MIRDTIKAAQIAAMKAGDKPRLSTIRLMMAKIKDRDIELRSRSKPASKPGPKPRGDGTDDSSTDDSMIIEALQKMLKQRRESIVLYEQGGRGELAAIEAAEIAIITEFLPAQMDEATASATISALIAELGASSVKDMGRVMAALKERHAHDIDRSKAARWTKAALGAKDDLEQ